MSNIVKDFLIAVSKWFFNRTNAWKEAFVEKRNKDSEQHWLVVKNSLLFVWHLSRIYPKSGIYIAGDCWNTSTNCRSVAFIRNFELTSREHPPPKKKPCNLAGARKVAQGLDWLTDRNSLHILWKILNKKIKINHRRFNSKDVILLALQSEISQELAIFSISWK